MAAAKLLEPGVLRRRGPDLVIAAVLAVILTVGWAINDWARLSHFLLPDTDDMVRLTQVRDWLGGQGINDWIHPDAMPDCRSGTARNAANRQRPPRRRRQAVPNALLCAIRRTPPPGQRSPCPRTPPRQRC